ncbi:MAG: discoidin domain-containing protein [Brachybacterium tyrofermentans]
MDGRRRAVGPRPPRPAADAPRAHRGPARGRLRRGGRRGGAHRRCGPGHGARPARRRRLQGEPDRPERGRRRVRGLHRAGLGGAARGAAGGSVPAVPRPAGHGDHHAGHVQGLCDRADRRRRPRDHVLVQQGPEGRRRGAGRARGDPPDPARAGADGQERLDPRRPGLRGVLELSADGETWTEIGTTDGSAVATATLDEPLDARFCRLRVTAKNPTGQWVQIREFGVGETPPAS